MPMTPLERKAAFRNAVLLRQTTCEIAAKAAVGVTWHHLREGLNDLPERPLSDEVKKKFAAYIGSSVAKVFGAKRKPVKAA